MTKIIAYIVILACGLGCAWLYGRTPKTIRALSKNDGRGDRPWRAVGAAICVVVSVMFVVGVAAVDIPERPGMYAAYWLVILVLVLWLCVLAIKDLLYTRRLLAEWQREREHRVHHWRLAVQDKPDQES